MEDGLPRRATELRAATDRLAGGDRAARDEIRRLAHKLRGTAGSHGYAALGEEAGRVEAAAAGPDADDAALVRAALGLVTSIARAQRTAADGAVEDASTSGAPRASAVGASALPSLGGKRLLAIDDDPATRRLLELTLRTMGGSDARILESPTEALELAARERFDLAIVDAMMPECTGLDFARALRARESARSLRIAFLSAASSEELGWTLPEGSTWLRKPFRPRDLLASIAELLDGDERAR